MDLRVDLSNLKRFARDCKLADPALAKEFLNALKDAGEIVAIEARKKANAFPGKHRTTRISSSIKVRRRGTVVKIQAGGPGAPEAGPLEFGSQGNNGQLRHPLFGDYDNWHSQPSHPFLAPAAEEAMPAVELAVLGAVDIATAVLAL
jgi:hypothetical protein